MFVKKKIHESTRDLFENAEFHLGLRIGASDFLQCM